MDKRTIFGSTARLFNAGMLALKKAPVIGPKLGDAVTEISYVGKKSGRTITTPVSVRRSGEDVVIGVAAPDMKTWWRNFLGEGAPITVRLDGVDRQGHGVAHRADDGKVTVQVTLAR
ncbi:MAG: hypothetical protein HOQ24_03540 [Mycobacteriaceae bacterium]|nr:hypothetical protein [Mycobacteriaceae bacterium]